MTEGEIENNSTQESNQSVPVEQPKKSNTVLIIVAVVAVCCIVGAIALFAGGFLLFDSVPQYHNETVGQYTFKIPAGFEKNPSKIEKEYTEFKNDTDKFIRIMDMRDRVDLYDFALVMSLALNGTVGDITDINGTSAYKFNTVDSEGSGQPMYLYAINIDGKNYVVIISKGVTDPDEVLASMIL